MHNVSRDDSPGLTGYDAELRLHNEVLRRACAIQPDDRILDVGCGAGRTTREAARGASVGHALGIDTSASAIKKARESAQSERLENVSFEHADAQLYPFAPQSFDLAMSRFGTMFFDDPVDAFTNIGRALSAAGRLVMMVWQDRDLNEWDVVVRHCLGSTGGAFRRSSGEPDAFSLADPLEAREILRAAGFGDIAWTDVDAPVFYGPDVATALAWIRGFTSTISAMEQLLPVAADRVVQRLTDAVAAHLEDDGVWFDSRAWLVTAHR